MKIAADTNGHEAGLLESFASGDKSTNGCEPTLRYPIASKDVFANGHKSELSDSLACRKPANGKEGQPEKVRFSYPVICENISEIQNDLNEILQSGQLSNFGKYSQLLEHRLQQKLGVRHILTVPNATTGLQVLLSTLPQQSEVLLPSFTFPATAHAVIHANLIPRFVDIDPLTFTISLEDLLAKINDRTSAILAVNIFGNPCRIAQLENLAKKEKIKLFFDSAPAMGSKYQGQYLGSRGDAEVFSMSVTKIVSAGEGGFIATNNDLLADQIVCMRNYGYSPDRSDCPFYGYNGKLSEVHAVLALKALEKMDSNIARRHDLAELYKLGLQNLSGVSCQAEVEESEMNYCNFAIRIDSDQAGIDTAKACHRLAEENIEYKRYFYPILHKTRAYRNFDDITLLHSETLADQVLCLPMHAKLSNEQVERVCKVFVELHEHSKKQSQQVFLSKRASTASQNQNSFQSGSPSSGKFDENTGFESLKPEVFSQARR